MNDQNNEKKRNKKKYYYRNKQNSENKKNNNEQNNKKNNYKQNSENKKNNNEQNNKKNNYKQNSENKQNNNKQNNNKQNNVNESYTIPIEDTNDFYVKKIFTIDQNPKIDKLIDQIFITSIKPQLQVKQSIKKNSFKPDILKKIDIIDNKINSLDDLINLGKLYEQPNFLEKNYSINIKGIYDMEQALVELKSLIGLDNIKRDILEFIMYFSQSLHKEVEFKEINKQPNVHNNGIFQLLSGPQVQHQQTSNNYNKTDNILVDDCYNDLKHMVIIGPPGCGKTILARIIAKICLHLGICINDTFKVVKRQDLIGEYLGHTAIKTQKVIDEAYGGVLFIDEAYSLGNRDKHTDSFAKECIDTINQNLTERKGEFICIIAGYETELDNNFFSINPGLKRRFPFVYKIEKYTSIQLLEILLLKIKLIEWEIEKETVEWLKKTDYFKDKLDNFPHYAGDIEVLLFNIKIEHGKRIFGKHIYLHKTLNKDDIINGYKRYLSHRDKKSLPYNHLYI